MDAPQADRAQAERHLRLVVERAEVLDPLPLLAVSKIRRKGEPLYTNRSPANLNGGLTAALDYAVDAVANRFNVYLNPLQKPTTAGYSASRRGSEADSAGWAAVVLDIDVKPGCASSKEEAATFVAGLAGSELAPSLVIDSGGGLQLWFLLDEVVTGLAEYRALAAALHSELCRRSGWKLDPVTDGARMMRLAGTLMILSPGMPILPTRIFSVYSAWSLV